MTKETFTSIDLFSGPGGIATGFEWANIKPLIAVEWSDHTISTYLSSHNALLLELKYYQGVDPNNYCFIPSSNNQTVLIHGDIRKVSNILINKILNERFNVNKVDVVTGGAPCESFSLAGTRSEEDERNTLFLNVIRIARSVDSHMFVFENVKGLLSKKNHGIKGKMFEDICDEFERTDNLTGASFKLASRNKSDVLLNSSNYGVPQNRERIFLVGINRKYSATFNYPYKTHGPGRDFDYVTTQDALEDLPDIDSGEGADILEYDFNFSHISQKYNTSKSNFLSIIHGIKIGFEYPKYINHDENIITVHKAVNHRAKMIQRMKLILPGEGMKHAANRLINSNNEELVKLYFPKKLYAARNRRLDPSKPSFTVTSHVLDEMIHPTKNRGLTPREAARLQSFPDWYVFEGPYVKFHSDPEQDKYEQIGDAIPPLLAFALGTEVYNTISNIKNSSL